MSLKYINLNFFRRMIIYVVLLWTNFLFCEESFYSWDFSDCEIKDIIYAISLDTGISIVADDTVCGKASLKFYGNEIDKAFDSFMKNSRLFVKKTDGLWTVSRFSIEENDKNFSVDAYNLFPHQILEKISERINQVITFDSLPAVEISIHLKNLSLEEILDSICLRLAGYEVLKNKNGYHFARISVQNKESVFNGSMNVDWNEKNGFSVDAKNCSFVSLIENLFVKYGGERQFCFLYKNDSVVPRCSFSDKSFDVVLSKLCVQNGFKVILIENIYYISLDVNSRDSILKDERFWTDIKLNYSKAANLLPVIQKKYKDIEFLISPDKYSFLCKASMNELEDIQLLIKKIDINQKTYSIDLQYIKTEDFLKIIPKSFDLDNIQVMEGKSTICFKGSQKEYEELLSQISICDVPVKRINYDLLILQYDENSQNSWSSSFSVGRINQGDSNDISLQLGSVLGWNFNVLTSFGLEFSHSLQTSIEENKTKVFTDTTLHGVSGKQINFKNTNTYRYRDNNIDPETGKPIYSGVTKEIVSGLKLDICGWVSGNGMITSTVTASVSRQGSDTSSSTGNPPPTTEKIVTTEVCCKNGEPIILSGLIQNADVLEEKRSPGISKIPFLGNLFKNREKVSEKTQMVIYLVPHVISYEKNTYFENIDNSEWIKKTIQELFSIEEKKEIYERK